MSDIVMPRLSDTMEDGTVLRWLKHDGEHVSRGEELVEIETDKAAMIYESDRDGVLATVAREGDTLPVGELIARIGEPVGDGEATGDGEGPLAADTPVEPASMGAPPVEASSVERALGKHFDTASGERANSPPASRQTPEGAAAERGKAGDEGRVKASPLARRIARKAGIDLGALTGSGPGGRIVKADVEASAMADVEASAVPALATDDMPTIQAASGASTEDIPRRPAAPPAAAPVEQISSAKGDATTVEPSRTQRTIARRMAESKATIPDFTLTADVDMERCVELRTELKRLSHADAPTYNDMIVKACALALREYPRANAGYRDARFELHSRVNVGVAVAVGAEDPTGGALVVPTVFDADTKALGEIARETRALTERVRDGSVTPPELSGGTFTVSNLGMYAIASFTAIINPPQAAILAVGAVAPRPVIHKKKVVARQTMSLTLACDHRILYGADAALFLGRIRELLEEPAALTL
jgi:pyruvate dehydrogenase E2 component (dihydrolipoamide acetyltransferase)